MKVKVTLERAGGITQDLVVTADATCTVGALADYLTRADPRSTVTGSTLGSLTLTVMDGSSPRQLDPRVLLADSPIRSGSHIGLLPAGQAYQGIERDGVAIATVTEGPDAGREFPLASGANIVGRLPTCEVRLSDTMASRQHARINVSDHVEVIDLGSANGVEVNDVLVSRSEIRPTDVIRIGDTAISVRLVQVASAEGRTEASSVGFIRSPVVAPLFEGVEFEAPELPERQSRQPFPAISLIAPLVMAGVLYLTTHNPSSFILAGLTPLMLVGNFVEQRRQGRKVDKAALATFRADLLGLRDEVTALAEVEVATRLLENPSTADCVEAAHGRRPLMWSRRPGEPGFLELRLGLSTRASRSTIKGPEARRAPRDLYAEAMESLRPLGVVHGVPVVADPMTAGALGVAGPRSAAIPVARALVAQWATLHTPGHLTLAVLGSGRSSGDWDWVKWLPHVGSVFSPLTVSSLASTPLGASTLLAELEAVVEQRETDPAAGEVSPALPVVVVVEGDCPVDFGRLNDLAEHGWRVGVHVMWVAPEVEQLPAACRTFVDVSSLGQGTVGYVHDRGVVTPVELEVLAQETAERLARALSPVVDLGARVEDDSDLPRKVSFLAMEGHTGLGDSPDAVLERWTLSGSIISGPRAPESPSGRAATLRAAVGKRGAEILSLDLRSDGPHALVGGTTGSGKSELLQTWILSMAASHSPQRLTFLLVDYKGGSAFAECAQLPHTVGLVTDLDPNGVHRALTSLRAELRYREELLAKHGKAKDLVTLERNGVLEAPPSLVIVVDEFAALVQEVPEFVEGVVNVAQRGRSLGLHLVLATQRPAGVIKDNLRANTNLRLALRVAEEGDSTDVLGSPDAAFFDPDLPGRAVSKTGPGRLVAFQTAYVGGHTSAIARPPDILVEELGLAGCPVWEIPVADRPVDPRPSGPTDISRVVTQITRAQEVARLPVPRRPWLPDLRAHYDLRTEISRSGDDRDLLFGVRDEPERQAQRPVGFRPEEGNLAVYGASGSGKSTLLRSLAVVAGLTFDTAPCHVYALDFASRGLSLLADLPHVGAVINSGDDERVRRLIRWLGEVAEQRAVRYGLHDTDSISTYRSISGDAGEPRILLLLDGIHLFRQTYESDFDGSTWEGLLALASTGRAVGIHLVVTADRAGAVPTQLAATIQQQVVLRLSDANDYGNLGVPPDMLTTKSPAGRAVVGGLEVQVGVLGGSADLRTQTEEVKRLSALMRSGTGTPAAPVLTLADHIRLSDLQPVVGSSATIGVAGETLGPIGVATEGTLVVTGSAGSGRQEAVLVVAEAVARCVPGTARFLFTTNRRSILASEGTWSGRAVGIDEASDLAARLQDEFERVLTSDGVVRAVIVVEEVSEWDNSLAELPLTSMLKVALRAGALVVTDGEIAHFRKYGLSATLNSSRTGLMLQPETGDGADQFSALLPLRLRRADLPRGRGYLVRGGRSALLQVAVR